MKYDTKKFIESCNNDRDMKDYSITGSYKGSKEKIKILHKKCKREFLMIAANFKNLKYSCPLCKRDNMKIFDNDTLDQFLYKDLKNEYLRIGDYKNSSSKLEIKHLKCGNSILIRVNDLRKGHGCSYCKGNKKLLLKDIENRIVEIDDNYTLDSSINYKNVHSVLNIKHLECGNVFKKSFNNFRNGQRCPICQLNTKNSKAVNEIIDYLEENFISYETEKKLPVSNKRSLRSDFYLKDFDAYIEYDGKQHYKYEKSGYFNEEKFNKIRENDSIKDNYFISNKKKFFRISYKENHIERIKEIINELSGVQRLSKVSETK